MGRAGILRSVVTYFMHTICTESKSLNVSTLTIFVSRRVDLFEWMLSQLELTRDGRVHFFLASVQVILDSRLLLCFPLRSSGRHSLSPSAFPSSKSGDMLTYECYFLPCKT
jgi:hypothetical protein